MKVKMSWMIVCAAVLSACAQTVSIKVATDHPDCVYSCGDTASFTVTVLETNGVPAKAGTLAATIDNFGNKKVVERTIDLATENPFTLKAKKDIPGFLRLQVKSRTKGLKVAANKGRAVRSPGASPTIPRRSSRVHRSRPTSTRSGRMR